MDRGPFPIPVNRRNIRANSGAVLGHTHMGIADLVAGLKRLPVMPGGNGAGAKV